MDISNQIQRHVHPNQPEVKLYFVLPSRNGDEEDYELQYIRIYRDGTPQAASAATQLTALASTTTPHTAYRGKWMDSNTGNPSSTVMVVHFPDGAFYEEASHVICTIRNQSSPYDQATIPVIIDRRKDEYLGKIWFDANSSNPFAVFGLDGKPARRTNSDTSALTLLGLLQSRCVHVLGTLTASASWANVGIIEGERRISTFDINGKAIDCDIFRNIIVKGALSAPDETISFEDCHLLNVTNLGGVAYNCSYEGTIGIGNLSGMAPYTDVGGSHSSAQVSFDLAGANRNCLFKGWKGYMKHISMDDVTSVVTVFLDGGVLEVDSSCTLGTITVEGEGRLIGSGGGVTLIDNRLGANNGGTIKRNTPIPNFEFLMLKYDDGYPALGGTVFATKSVDGGAAVPMTNVAIEVGDGIYKIDISGADTDGEIITWIFKSLYAKNTYITVMTYP